MKGIISSIMFLLLIFACIGAGNAKTTISCIVRVNGVIVSTLPQRDITKENVNQCINIQVSPCIKDRIKQSIERKYYNKRGINGI